MKYVARVILHFTEKEFWLATPREMLSLIEVHCELNDPDKEKKKENAKVHFIDEVF